MNKVLRKPKAEYLVVAMSLLVLLVGWALEQWLGDHSHAFQRSGSVLVCIGVISGYLDFKRLYTDNYATEVQSREKKRLETDIVHSDEALSAKVRGSTDELIDRAQSIKEAGERRVGLIDIAVLIFGTLVWGFGDLIF